MRFQISDFRFQIWSRDGWARAAIRNPQSAIRNSAFTLIELLMALAACGILLAAIYGVFSRAVHLRDGATQRTREVRVRAHAMAVLRNDLRNALVSGGTLAAILQGSRESHGSGFPGYLKFTTTTAKDVEDEFGGDVQQVEYYIARDAEAADQKAGVLVRTIQRDLLSTVQQTPPEERVLAGVESMEVSFYSGTAWKESWEWTTESKTLPEAVRVRVQPVADKEGRKPAAIELVVPWTTQSAIETTMLAITSGGFV